MLTIHNKHLTSDCYIMSKEKCRICGEFGNSMLCNVCCLKSCEKCFNLHNGSCDILAKEKTTKCSIHDLYLDKYCFYCSDLFCKNCKNHLNHQFLSIPEAVHTIRYEIQSTIQDLNVREAQEESATTQFGARKEDYVKKIPAIVDEEEQRLQNVITEAKCSLVKQVVAMADSQFGASKEVLSQIVAAKKNLESAQQEKFPLLLLSRWSNPCAVIDKHKDILKIRDSPDQRVIENDAGICRMFRNSLLK